LYPVLVILHWFTRNWADTDEPDDPALAPLELLLSPTEALPLIQEVIAGLPRWRVEHVDAEGLTVTATRRTALWGFIDDVTLRLEAAPDGTRVHARSKSRVGAADLGQNRRNILELFRALAQSG
jgi:uncharacterized protein (DUF1499 family)